MPSALSDVTTDVLTQYHQSHPSAFEIGFIIGFVMGVGGGSITINITRVHRTNLIGLSTVRRFVHRNLHIDRIQSHQ